MNDSPLKPASSRRKKMDKTMMAIYFLILFIVAGAALLAFLCLSKPSDKKNKAGSDPSIASSSTLKNSHQTGTDAKSTAKAKIKEEKPVDPYENLAVANVDDALNLREKPDTDAKVLGTCSYMLLCQEDCILLHNCSHLRCELQGDRFHFPQIQLLHHPGLLHLHHL